MKTVRWFLFNGLFALCMYLAFVEGIEGASNVVMVAAWVTIVLAFFCPTPPVVEAFAKSGRSVPRWMNVVFDLSCCVAFAWFGWVWTAVFWLIHHLLQEVAWDKAMEAREAGA